jgi:hypothetical protein
MGIKRHFTFQFILSFLLYHQILRKLPEIAFVAVSYVFCVLYWLIQSSQTGICQFTFIPEYNQKFFLKLADSLTDFRA